MELKLVSRAPSLPTPTRKVNNSEEERNYIWVVMIPSLYDGETEIVENISKIPRMKFSFDSSKALCFRFAFRAGVP